jgi:hypothetical protein
MRLNRRLNLVIPLHADDGKTVLAYVHAVPLGEEIVEKYYQVLGQTFTAIYTQGFGVAAGPGVGYRLLRQLSEAQKIWDDLGDEPGVKNGLVEEMLRLSSVVSPVKGRWQALPVRLAADQGFIDPEDLREIENALVFFTAVSATLPRTQRREHLDSACNLWGWQITSSDCSGFVSGLKTSTETGNSGKKVPGAAAAPAAEPATAAPPVAPLVSEPY